MRSAAKYIWIILIIGFVGGFLLAETSGLLGRSPVTTSTVVAKVNGKDIPYLTWAGAAQQLAQQQEQQTQRGLTLDERRQVDEQAYNQLVNDALLQQEYEKRGIRVTDAEVVEAAKYNPPPQFQQAAELQTDGRFDPAKYQRFLASPGARTQGLLVQLENYYRTEIPKQKLFAQIAGDVYVTDARLWQIWKDTHDSATVSYVAFKPDVTAEAKAAVTGAEAQAYYSAHTKEFERQGKATLSMMMIPRRPTAADSALTVAKIEALRAEITKGAKFDDVAKRESDDTVSGKNGGDLGKGGKGRFVKAFDDAAYKLSKGELSAPVKTQFGVHLIKVEERKGDTLTLKHILKLYKQGDSSPLLATARRRRRIVRPTNLRSSSPVRTWPRSSIRRRRSSACLLRRSMSLRTSRRASSGSPCRARARGHSAARRSAKRAICSTTIRATISCVSTRSMRVACSRSTA
jgi:peptidyl-prolyl cis-trans isomerase D